MDGHNRRNSHSIKEILLDGDNEEISDLFALTPQKQPKKSIGLRVARKQGKLDKSGHSAIEEGNNNNRCHSIKEILLEGETEEVSDLFALTPQKQPKKGIALRMSKKLGISNKKLGIANKQGHKETVSRGVAKEDGPKRRISVADHSIKEILLESNPEEISDIFALTPQRKPKKSIPALRIPLEEHGEGLFSNESTNECSTLLGSELNTTIEANDMVVEVNDTAVEVDNTPVDPPGHNSAANSPESKTSRRDPDPESPRDVIRRTKRLLEEQQQARKPPREAGDGGPFNENIQNPPVPRVVETSSDHIRRPNNKQERRRSSLSKSMSHRGTGRRKEPVLPSSPVSNARTLLRKNSRSNRMRNLAQSSASPLQEEEPSKKETAPISPTSNQKTILRRNSNSNRERNKDRETSQNPPGEPIPVTRDRSNKSSQKSDQETLLRKNSSSGKGDVMDESYDVPLDGGGYRVALDDPLNLDASRQMVASALTSAPSSDDDDFEIGLSSTSEEIEELASITVQDEDTQEIKDGTCHSTIQNSFNWPEDHNNVQTHDDGEEPTENYACFYSSGEESSQASSSSQAEGTTRLQQAVQKMEDIASEVASYVSQHLSQSRSMDSDSIHSSWHHRTATSASVSMLGTVTVIPSLASTLPLDVDEEEGIAKGSSRFRGRRLSLSTATMTSTEGSGGGGGGFRGGSRRLSMTSTIGTDEEAQNIVSEEEGAVASGSKSARFRARRLSTSTATFSSMDSTLPNDELGTSGRSKGGVELTIPEELFAVESEESPKESEDESSFSSDDDEGSRCDCLDVRCYRGVEEDDDQNHNHGANQTHRRKLRRTCSFYVIVGLVVFLVVSWVGIGLAWKLLLEKESVQQDPLPSPLLTVDDDVTRREDTRGEDKPKDNIFQK